MEVRKVENGDGGFFSRKKHVKQVIFIDFLRWLGHPLAGFSCMSSSIKGAIKLIFTCAHLFFTILMHFLIVNMNKLDLIRYLPYPRKMFFVNFPGSLWSYRVGCNRFFLFRMRKNASVCKPVCLYFTFFFSKERRFLKRF